MILRGIQTADCLEKRPARSRLPCCFFVNLQISFYEFVRKEEEKHLIKQSINLFCHIDLFGQIYTP